MTGMSFKKAYRLTFVILTLTFLLNASKVPLSDPVEKIRSFTRPIEFDYLSWTLDAFGTKFSEIALGTSNYLNLRERSDTVLQALDLIRKINQVEGQIYEIYADPSIIDPEDASMELVIELNELRVRRDRVEPLAEAILQDQVNEIAATSSLAFGGQALPPVLFRTTPPPDALIISPRNVIRQDHNISISPDISADQMNKLEDAVDQSLNVSSLVVGIGGIGLYPTMVMETTDINGLAEIVAHEWVHNYLTLRPLGFSYLNSPELRTMNETAASIAGKELSRAVIEKYYPEFLPPQDFETGPSNANNQEDTPPVFNVNAELHETRVTVDRMLAEGKTEAAESYMEMRRRFLWDNGYHIRKLNQAYFAFYGAYADQPGGAAGEDPVGEAVRILREKSTSLADFINRISWMWKFDQLMKAVESF